MQATTKKRANQLNIRIKQHKKEQLKEVAERLNTTTSKLIKGYIDNIIKLHSNVRA